MKVFNTGHGMKGVGGHGSGMNGGPPGSCMIKREQETGLFGGHGRHGKLPNSETASYSS